MDALTRAAVQRLHAGDLERARQILAGALLQDRGNLEAWLCLAVAAESASERAACLRQALKLDPHNPLALRALNELEKNKAPAPGNAGRSRSGLNRAREGRDFFPGRRPHWPISPAQRHETRFDPPGRGSERLVFQTRPSLAVTVFWGLAILLLACAAMWVFRGSDVVRFLILLPVLTAALGVYFLHFLSRHYSRYTLTTGRLVIDGGLVFPTRVTLPLEQIAAVTLRPSWLGSLFGAADLVVVDREEREYHLYAVVNSRTVLADLQTALAPYSRK